MLLFGWLGITIIRIGVGGRLHSEGFDFMGDEGRFRRDGGLAGSLLTAGGGGACGGVQELCGRNEGVIWLCKCVGKGRQVHHVPRDRKI